MHYFTFGLSYLRTSSMPWQTGSTVCTTAGLSLTYCTVHTHTHTIAFSIAEEFGSGMRVLWYLSVEQSCDLLTLFCCSKENNYMIVQVCLNCFHEYIKLIKTQTPLVEESCSEMILIQQRCTWLLSYWMHWRNFHWMYKYNRKHC